MEIDALTNLDFMASLQKRLAVAAILWRPLGGLPSGSKSLATSRCRQSSRWLISVASMMGVVWLGASRLSVLHDTQRMAIATNCSAREIFLSHRKTRQ